jgi:hypothetical protein
MEIIKLKGTDPQLFSRMAHLVMNETVLKYNLNYPYKTSPNYYWFIALDGDDNILGFVPVDSKEGKVIINNYYVVDDNSEVFSALLKEVILSFQADSEIESVAQVRHIPYFEQNGFSTILLWKRYAKMKVLKNGKKRLRIGNVPVKDSVQRVR